MASTAQVESLFELVGWLGRCSLQAGAFTTLSRSFRRQLRGVAWPRSCVPLLAGHRSLMDDSDGCPHVCLTTTAPAALITQVVSVVMVLGPGQTPVSRHAELIFCWEACSHGSQGGRAAREASK